MLNISETRNLRPTANQQSGNFILAQLFGQEYRELSSDLQLVELKSHKIIHHPHERAEYVYFPKNSMISSVKIFKDGTTIETGSIGREGMTGVSAALSKKASSEQSIVQIPGEAWRIKTDKFQVALKREGLLKQLISEFIFAYLTETAQSAACNAHHSVTERLAKWLLVCGDKTGRCKLELTQDFISQMLGVHRPGITLAALTLKDAGLINYQRGTITIIDNKGLKELSCECYETIKSEYERRVTI